MQRRTAIKNMALASIAAMVMTRCSLGDQKVSDFLNQGKLALDKKHSDYLNQISETFLPLSDKNLNIEQPAKFILTMVNDCKSDEEILDFTTGFEEYKNLMTQAQLQISSEDSAEVLNQVKSVLQEKGSDESLIYFIKTVRDLSIQNLTTSQTYMQNYLDYELIPSTYIACTTITNS